MVRTVARDLGLLESVGRVNTFCEGKKVLARSDINQKRKLDKLGISLWVLSTSPTGSV